MSAVTPEDRRKHEIATTIVQSENQRLIDVATHLVTVSFSAIAVVLTLQEKWLGTPPSTGGKSALAAAIVLYLGAAVLTTLAAGAYVHRITTADYSDVDAELHRVATLRYRLTSAGFVLILLATIIVSIVAMRT
jgi:uncharacterized membrane protein (DUF485 family)